MDYPKNDNFPDAVLLKAEPQMRIIAIIPYNPWIIPIIHRLYNNPHIILPIMQYNLRIIPKILIHELLALHQVRSFKRKAN